MPTKQIRVRRNEVLDRILAAGKDRLAADATGLGEAFLRAFYAHLPPDDVVDEDAEDLFGAAMAVMRLTLTRKDHHPIVRAYNPSYEDDGWAANRTIIEVVNDDMPFLVDSIRGALNARDLTVHLVIHPILAVTRDDHGRMTALSGQEDMARESVMQLRVTAVREDEELRAIEADLRATLADVRAAVDDWPRMRTLCRETVQLVEGAPALAADEEPKAEIAAFLQWMDEENFAFLGYRAYAFSGAGLAIEQGSGLGVLRDDAVRLFDGLRDFQALPAEVRAFVTRSARLLTTKANRLSTVHRRVPMDAVIVKTFDDQGSVSGLRVFAGLYTSDAYNRRPKEIPLLRRKIDAVMARSGLLERSHDGRRLQHILDVHPRDELFQASVEELSETAIGVLHLQDRQRIALFTRIDPFERFVSCLVFLPRDNYDTDVRLKIQTRLEAAYAGKVQAFYTRLSDDVLARLHFVVATQPGAIPATEHADVEQRILDVARSWSDALRDALIQTCGEAQGAGLARRYRRAFPPGYRDAFSGRDAVGDVREVEAVLGGEKPVSIHLYRPHDAPDSRIALKIGVPDAPAPISDILPILENMGLRVVAEHPHEITPAGSGRTVWVHDYHCDAVSARGTIDPPKVRDVFEAALDRVIAGAAEDDGFNRLTLAMGLDWREIAILRAYAKYLKQAAFPFSQDYIEDALERYAHLARDLVQYFRGLFDPDAPPDMASDRRAAIEIALMEVESLDDDRILRRFVNVIEATLRTNYFRPDADGAPKAHISLKLASREIEELPAPRPFREIFVYSPRVEGVHLRFGKVARGGLRWSDRREDFRTEILGLVKAQQVKNAVIVPVGSKGGFFVKRPPAASEGRDAMIGEGVACYKTFIGGLLDITDTLDGDAVIPPPRVVRRDEDDPYLVVAADKGTATFSDIANGVAQDYGFWLGDAFASGGSVGYDHKKMGITARGAWESVKRHFREIGVDCQNEAFTCVGVGDMSGDVFGNGMLLSQKTRLVAAFNHLHIFIDPDPDPAVSWAERQRLFALPRSAWTDYDASLISKGGGVFDRKAKAIALTPEIAALTGFKAGDSVQPNTLISALLKAPVDLLWFGGIGTYVKAAEESHAEAGDRANDALRVNGADLKAKIIGEGANLGVTQRGRIEYAARGGRLNTDAVDNSAGVDCSDHEVNIKILLGMVEAAGDMTRKQRDALLAEMTDEVAELVLRDNYRQTLAITMMELRAAPLLDEHARFIRRLEKSGRLDRRLEFLPDEEEIADRRAARKGLYRPELSVLLAYAKLELYDILLESNIPDDPLLIADLKSYFPTPLQARFGDVIERHRLKREIIATYVVNSIVNRVGASFVSEACDLTGFSAADVARAYTVVRDAFDLRPLWLAIDALDYHAPAALQHEMLREIQRLIDRAVMWFLRHESHPMDISALNAAYTPGVAALRETIGDLITAENRQVVDRRVAGYVERGAPEDLAWRIGALTQLSPAMDIVQIAKDVGSDPVRVGQVYLALGEMLSFDWLRKAANTLARDSHWVEMATQAIVDDLVASQTAITFSVFRDHDGDKAAWLASRQIKLDHARDLLAEMRTIGSVDLAMLAVAARELKGLAEG